MLTSSDLYKLALIEEEEAKYSRIDNQSIAEEQDEIEMICKECGL